MLPEPPASLPTTASQAAAATTLASQGSGSVRRAGTLLQLLPLWLAAVWALSLSVLGFFVVPMLFANLPTPSMAGIMAGHLFAVQSGISLVCTTGLLLLAGIAGFVGLPSAVARSVGRSALAGMVVVAVVQWVVSPHILAHDNLPLWHGMGSGLYLVQWCCALWAFARISVALVKRPPSA